MPTIPEHVLNTILSNSCLLAEVMSHQIRLHEQNKTYIFLLKTFYATHIIVENKAFALALQIRDIVLTMSKSY